MWLEVILLNFLINIFPEIAGFVNLAHTPVQNLQGTASWNVEAHTSTWSADKVVDGDTRQDHLPTCAIAAYGTNTYTSVWWKVWLDRKFNIAYVEIYLRTITTNRATGFSIYTYEDTSFEPPSGVTGTLIFKHDPMSGCPGDVQKINVNKISQGVAFFNERPDGFTSICSGTSLTKTSIEICEVKVMGCDQNRYGDGCVNKCNDKCKDRHCDAFNGLCIYGCSDPGAVSLNCRVCNDGTYALNGVCEQCGHCKDDIPCDKGTGNCSSGCKKNWTGHLCKECADGYYGEICSTQCGNCLYGVCDKSNGNCPSGCTTNWKTPLCQECVDGFYDQKCTSQCGQCREGFCNKINGSCSSGCKPNWKAPICQ
ncbi:cell death abnormality protein 1-like, partial [Saccostrea cucullata]|uniref:cell death abnormality protein 1-like n=1 Tax=Saccostrea cuccullata TaxID=36930 RepID=UPI002ED59337